MSKKVIGSDGKVYKQVVPSDPNRKRTPELIVGGIGLLLSVVGLMSSFGAAAIADAFGGGGIYTLKMSLGLLLAIVSFILLFFINKKRVLIGWLVLAFGWFIHIVLLWCLWNYWRNILYNHWNYDFSKKVGSKRAKTI